MLLEVNGVESSCQHPDPEHLVFEYMRWMRTILGCVRPDRDAALDIAHLGGGGCSLPRALAHTYPASRHHVVEIDALLAEYVRTWFSLPRSPRVRIRVADAAEALQSWREDRFDVLVRDVFAGDRTPDSLTSVIAARHVSRVLRPDGVYLANCATAPGVPVLADELATLATVFPHLAVAAEPAQLSGRRRGNAVIVASHSPLPAEADRALRADAVTVRWTQGSTLRSLIRSGRERSGDA